MKYVRFSADRLGNGARMFGCFYLKGGIGMALGRIHSIESMGLVDGPGIRSVVFLQGCRLRCKYCHNPDTWSATGTKTEEMTAEQLVAKLSRFKPYYKSGGGVTFSGGEPLLQKDFLLEVLPLCHRAGIHTCIDTAGFGIGGYEEILEHTDLILMDIKHYTADGYELITGQKIDESLKFLDTAQKMGKPLWIRHVVVPTLTDSDEHLKGLLDFIQTIKNVKKVELLPYHVLGVHKYETLGIKYSLEGIEPMNPEVLTQWQNRINNSIKAERTNDNEH